MMNSTNVQSETRRLKLTHTHQSVIDVEEDNDAMLAANRRMERSYDPEEVEANIEYQVINEGIPFVADEPSAPHVEKKQKVKKSRPAVNYV